MGGDIIDMLVKRQMHLIAEDILSYLDDASLHNCESVSKTWYFVIRNGNLWKRLFKRVQQKRPLLQMLHKRRLLESKHQTENDEFVFKRIFNGQKNLCKNWKSGIFSTESTSLGEVSVSIFVMDTNRILFGLRSSSSDPSSIMVWNRWTLKPEHILVGHQEWITDMQLCGDLIFCSYYDGTILVWDLSTKEVIQQFQDQEVVDWVVIHAAHGLLISCTSVASGPEANDRDTTITLRRICSPNEMVIERREEISEKKVCLIESDEKYFAVFLTTCDGTKLELRSTIDFQCLREIGYLISIEETFAYHSSRLVTGSSEGTIKVWDVESQTCKQTWSSTDNIEQLCLIPGRLITKNSQGKITVWDFPPDDSQTVESKSMEKLFQIESEEGGIMDPSLLADEFQIVTVSVKDISRTISKSQLIVRDFLKQTQ